MIYKVYFSSNGTPATGLTVTWENLLKVSDGTAYTPQPAFTELGGGWYKFTAAFTEAVVGGFDGSATLGNPDRYPPFDSEVIEGLTFADYIKRMLVVFDGDTTKVETDDSTVNTFLDSAGATETTHTLTAAGRTVT